MSKVIRGCFAFTLPSFVIGLKENSRYFLDQSDAKLKTHTWLPAFSRALSSLTFVLTGPWDKCGFGFSTLGENCSIGVEPLS